MCWVENEFGQEQLVASFVHLFDCRRQDAVSLRVPPEEAVRRHVADQDVPESGTWCKVEQGRRGGLGLGWVGLFDVEKRTGGRKRRESDEEEGSQGGEDRFAASIGHR